MPGYENAPATKMLASHCAVCARPLVDAKSVELGIGPDCRAKFGFDLDVPENARIEANALVWKIASVQNGPDVIPSVARLQALGFVSLADRITARVAKVRVMLDERAARYVVRTPYNADAVNVLWRVPGRRWEKGDKPGSGRNTFPLASREALFDALKACFAGEILAGPKGLVIL